MKNVILLSFCVLFIFSCKKDNPADEGCNGYTKGIVVERNTAIPIPFAHVQLMNSVPSETLPGDYDFVSVLDLQADAQGEFIFSSSQQAEFIYAYTTAAQHYFNPSTTAINFQSGKKRITIPMIPYSWLRIHVQDVEPLNLEIQSVWVSLDFKNELGMWQAVEDEDETVFGKMQGAQKYKVFYRLYTEPGQYTLHEIETPFIPPHDTLDMIIPY